MAARFTNRIGLEFYENEIRVVEIKVKGSEAVVGGFGAVPIEPGYLEHGVIAAPELVGGRLRAFLDQQGIGANEVVVSFPTSACVVRVMSLPKAPEAELRAIIDGEVEHYNLARNNGSYDFVLLDPVSNEDGGSAVLLMASDGLVTESVSETLLHAGLRSVALEPTHLGLLRTAHLLSPADHAMYLTLSEFKADMCLFSEGHLKFYRSFDVGTGMLSAHEGTDSMFPSNEPDGPESRGLNVDAASSLAVEVRRSIDFFIREYPNLPPIQRIIVCSNSEKGAPFALWLREAMGLVVESVKMDPAVMRPGGSSSEGDLDRYAAAYGLGMRDNPSVGKEIPRLDLSRHEQMVAELAITNRNARIGIYVVAAVVVAAGLGATFKTIQLNRSRAVLQQTERDLATARQMEAMRAESDRRSAERLVLLRKQGIPANNVVLAIGRSLPKDAGLVDLRVDFGRAELTAESTREDSVTSTMRALQTSPLITGVQLNSQELVDQDRKDSGFRFKMSLSLQTDGVFGNMALTPNSSGGIGY